MADKQFNPFDVLRVPHDAGDDVIAQAYRQRAKETHPDKGGQVADFLHVQEAFELLTTPEKRLRYEVIAEEFRAGRGYIPDRCRKLEFFKSYPDLPLGIVKDSLVGRPESILIESSSLSGPKDRRTREVSIRFQVRGNATSLNEEQEDLKLAFEALNAPIELLQSHAEKKASCTIKAFITIHTNPGLIDFLDSGDCTGILRYSVRNLMLTAGIRSQALISLPYAAYLTDFLGKNASWKLFPIPEQGIALPSVDLKNTKLPECLDPFEITDMGRWRFVSEAIMVIEKQVFPLTTQEDAEKKSMGPSAKIPNLKTHLILNDQKFCKSLTECGGLPAEIFACADFKIKSSQ